MLFIRPRLSEAGTSHTSLSSYGQPDGVTIAFELHGKFSRREATAKILDVLTRAKIGWMHLTDGRCIVDADALKRCYPTHFEMHEWFIGKIEADFEFEQVLQEPWPTRQDADDVLVRYPTYKRYITECKFLVTQEIALEQAPKKIFLSHKSSDKGQVRRFKAALEAVGFDVWLDEDAMTAGAELERSLIKGFKDSRAAVFFITPNYVDDGYLATEVDYAVAEKREKRDDFSIITLVYKDENGKEGQVPSLLRKFVWKQPLDELSAFVEIVRALPMSPTAR
jgi:hypothetical protein